MNDQPLSQDLKDYTKDQQELIQKIIDEEREKTRAWAAFRVDGKQTGADADAVLIGGSGTLPGIFDAISDG